MLLMAAFFTTVALTTNWAQIGAWLAARRHTIRRDSRKLGRTLDNTETSTILASVLVYVLILALDFVLVVGR